MIFKAKMLLVLGTVTLLLIGTTLTLNHQSRHFTELQQSQVSAVRLEARLLDLRRYEKALLAGDNGQASASFRTKMHEIDERFSRLIDRLDALSIDSAAASSLRQVVREYTSQLDSPTGGQTGYEGRMEQLRPKVKAMEDRLPAFHAALEAAVSHFETTYYRTLNTAMISVLLIITALLLWTTVTFSRHLGRVTHEMLHFAEGDGDLSRRLTDRGSDEISHLARAFNTFARKIHDMLKGISEQVAELGETDDRVNEAAYETGSRMRRLRNNTQSVVVATEELSSTARDVANNVSHVSTSAQQADSLATEGRKIVEQAIDSINAFANEFIEAAETVTTLRSETENIGGILEVIRGIAEQTNLLALNAAIEAARAGEQGRGFAVVADEVRTLAHRSHESTNEIQELIERLQIQAETAMSKIQNGQQRISGTVDQAKMAGDALSRITESVSAISSMTIQIATAAAEQSAVVADINGNVLEIDNLARDTAQNADLTINLSADLSKAMAAVTRKMQQFHFENDEQLVLSQAKSSHLSWKGRLREFLDGKSHLTTEQAVSHHQCDFGKWYYSEGQARFGDKAEFRAIEQPHAEIHRLIKEAITQRANHDEAGAEVSFEKVSTLSTQIIKRIDDLTNTLG